MHNTIDGGLISFDLHCLMQNPQMCFIALFIRTDVAVIRFMQMTSKFIAIFFLKFHAECIVGNDVNFKLDKKNSLNGIIFKVGNSLLSFL